MAHAAGPRLRGAAREVGAASPRHELHACAGGAAGVRCLEARMHPPVASTHLQQRRGPCSLGCHAADEGCAGAGAAPGRSQLSWALRTVEGVGSRECGGCSQGGGGGGLRIERHGAAVDEQHDDGDGAPGRTSGHPVPVSLPGTVTPARFPVALRTDCRGEAARVAPVHLDDPAPPLSAHLEQGLLRAREVQPDAVSPLARGAHAKGGAPRRPSPQHDEHGIRRCSSGCRGVQRGPVWRRRD